MIWLRGPESFAAADDAENCGSAPDNNRNLLFIYTTENPSVISFMSEQIPCLLSYNKSNTRSQISQILCWGDKVNATDRPFEKNGCIYSGKEKNSAKEKAAKTTEMSDESHRKKSQNC